MRVGVIGGGFGVDGYLAALSGMPGVEVAAVADSGSGRVRARLADLSLYRPSWRDLLEPSINAVFIATPPATHRELVLTLLDRGKHVLCEKPFGMDPTQSREMVDMAANSAVVAAVTFQYRFEPGLQALKAMLDRGLIGELRAVECTWLTSGRRDARSPWTWRNDAAQGGGVIGAFLSHVVDNLQWLSGTQVCEVWASKEILVPRRPLANGTLADVTAEDSVKAGMTLTTDLKVSCHVSNCHPKASGMRMEFVGNDGRLVYSHSPPFTAATQEIHLHTDSAMPQRLFNAEQVLGFGTEDTRLPALRSLVERFARRAGGQDAADIPGFEDGWAVQRVLHAVRQSAATQEVCQV